MHLLKAEGTIQAFFPKAREAGDEQTCVLVGSREQDVQPEVIREGVLVGDGNRDRESLSNVRRGSKGYIHVDAVRRASETVEKGVMLHACLTQTAPLTYVVTVGRGRSIPM